MTPQVPSFARPSFLSCRVLEPGSAAVPASGQSFVQREGRADVLGRSVTLMRQEESRMKSVAVFRKSPDVIDKIGLYLDTPTLISMTATCKDWNNFLVHHEVKGVQLGTLSLRRAALRDYVAQHGFGLQKWKQYFGQDQEEVTSSTWRERMQLGLSAVRRAVFGAGKQVEKSRLPLEVLDILESPCPFFPGKQVKDTHILVYLPQTFEGKPVTLKSLGEFVKNLKKGSGGHSARYYYPNGEIVRQYGDEPTKASCWILMTKDVIRGSRGKSFEEQCKLIPHGRELEIPKVLEAVAGVFLHYVATGERLLPENLQTYSGSRWAYSASFRTYTRCQEQINDRCSVLVGGFIGSSLHVFSDDQDSEDSGVVVLRKFFGT